MILLLCSIYDTKAERYIPPFTYRTLADAIRGFTHITNDPQSMVSKNPEDFELVQLGNFDEDTGDIVASDVKLIARANDVITRPNTPIDITDAVNRKLKEKAG